jgi:polysaccharide export outer membrane protein
MLSKITVKNITRLLLAILVVFSTSCSTNRKIIYFQDIQSTKAAELENTVDYKEPLIQPNDNLSINIFTLNQQTGAIINQAATTPIMGTNSNSSSVGPQGSGFIVDKNGDVELALAGKIRVGGLTTFDAREVVRKRVTEFYNQPNVELRLANFKVSVLGEVKSPSTYNMQSEKTTVMDAISVAGDLTVYGRRDNVLVVRDIDGKKTYAHLDLNSSSVFNSPYYYLRQNDLVYVEPNKARNAANNAATIQLISVIGSILSIVVLGISVLN